MTCFYALATSPSPHSGSTGAIGVITLTGDIAHGLGKLGIKPVPVGAARLRDWSGVDSIVVVVISPTNALLFPHGGAAITRRALAALDAAGFVNAIDPTPIERFPEARTLLEARMLAALQRAESPLAIDLLLDQPRRWAAAERDAALILPPDLSARLNFLIHPPTVVALGPPNIGKSSMLNTLAGRGVSIVADIPGTTRDHVGVSLNLAGLVVRYIDTPGIGPLAPTDRPEQDALDAQAQQIACRVAASADLLLLCADPTSAFLPPPTPAGSVLRVALRTDLGPAPAGTKVRVCVRDNSGLDVLVAAIKDRLIPPALLADPRGWAFWPMNTPISA
jgi:hypothetical protein